MQTKFRTFPIDAVLALSFAAYRVNSGYVKISKLTENNTRVWSNKEIVAYTLKSQEVNNNKYDNWVPSEFVVVDVTDEDVKNVELAKKHIKRYTLGLLSGKISAFQKDIFDAVTEENLPSTKISLVSYVPELILRETTEKERTRLIKENYKDSVHYNTSVSGTCEILKSFYLKNVECYVYVCGIDGNLVSFTNLKKYEVGTQHKITAKVKKQDYCPDTGLPQSRLHYVKFKKNDKVNKTD